MRNLSARFDIEALRGFAVGAVMLFHAGIVGINSGFIGVDIFFVISGYLIIGALHREYLREGRILVLDFWGRRARRLLPAITLVVALVAIASTFLVGRLTLMDIRYDLVAAAMFAGNLRFGVTGSDYWSTQYVSPVLHFWSLGVEEQFYIVAPMFILLVHLLFWRMPMQRMPRIMQLLLIATAILSLVYCLQLATTNPVWAYYSTTARAWEFALGGLAALIPAAKREFNKNAVTVFKLVLWAALLWSTVGINPALGYPGLTTMIPVAATSLLLWSGFGTSTVEQAITSEQLPAVKRAISWLGGISYSAYLWHWPLLWAASLLTHGSGQPKSLALVVSVPVLALTLLLAHLTKKYVEDPIRFRRSLVTSSTRSLQMGWKSSFAAIGVVGITALLPSTVLIPSNVLPTDVPQSGPTINPIWLMNDAHWLDRIIKQEVPAVNLKDTVDKAQPDITLVRSDIPEINDNGCHADRTTPEPTKRCTYGDPKGAKTIALMGDSHAAQYFTGLDIAAKERGYRLLPRTRASCPAADVTGYVPESNLKYTICDDWRKSVMRELRHTKPDMVIISNQRPLYVFDRNTGEMIKDQNQVGLMWRRGMKKTIDQLTEVGIHVLVLRDVPRWPSDVPDCLASKPATQCEMKPEDGLSPATDDIIIANKIDNARGIDLTNAICDPTVCFPIRGGIILSRDDAHLTRTYSVALANLWQALLVHELEQPAKKA